MNEETHPLLADIAASQRALHAAEADRVVRILRYRDAEATRIAALDPPMLRRVETSAVPLEIGHTIGWSDAQVQSLLHAADTVRDHAPTVWAAFLAGRFGEATMRAIARTISRLERPESIERLDAQASQYVPGRTLKEVQGWLRRFVSRVEADLAVERAQAENDKRYVDVAHGDDGMSELVAYLPSHQAAAIMARLRRDARQLKHDGDPRTQTQLQADLLTDWALTRPTSESATSETTTTPSGLVIDVAVLMSESDLTAETTGMAESSDGSWQVPVDWILQAGAEGHTFWHRLFTDPRKPNTFEHDYAGYAPPDSLRRAIVLRDGVCATPGCLVPAEHCDLDHHVPWPAGRTNGENLRPRSRRHHALKSHGALRVTDQPGIDRTLPPWPPPDCAA